MSEFFLFTSSANVTTFDAIDVRGAAVVDARIVLTPFTFAAVVM